LNFYSNRIAMLWSRRIFFALVALAVVQTVYYYPQLPDAVASHFDGAGVPNAWSGRDGFFALYLGMVLLLVGVFVLVPRWSEKRINFGMKIPNSKYWLAPERREATKLFFRRQMMWMGIAHLLLAIYTIQLVVEANLDATPILDDNIFRALGLYFICLIAWLLHFFLHFRKP